MKHIAIFIEDNNNRYQFRIDGISVFIYANCYNTAVQRLKDQYENDIEIKD